jgi:hypothetical protein
MTAFILVGVVLLLIAWLMRRQAHREAEMPLNSAVSRHEKMGGTRQCRFLAQLK